jgi:hypothetical protein
VTGAARALVVGFALAVAGSCAKPEPPPPPASPAVAFESDPAAVKRGKSLFIGMCGGYCHSQHDGARGDVPDLFDCEWKNGSTDQQIFDAIANGVPNTRMVGMKKLMPEGDTDIWKLVAFLRVDSDCKKPAP